MSDASRPLWQNLLRGLLMVAAVGVTVGSFFFRPGVGPMTPGFVLAAGGAVAVLAGLSLPLVGVARNGFWGVACAVGLLVWSAVAMLGSFDHYLSMVSITAWIGAVGILIAIQAAVPERNWWRLCAHLLVLGATAETVYAFYEIMPAFLEGQLPHPMGHFANQDTFAVLPMLGLMLATSLVDVRRRAETALLIPQCGLLLSAMLLTQARAAVVGLVAGYVAFTAIMLRHRDHSHRKQLVAIVAVPVLLGMLLLGADYLLPSLQKWQRLAEGTNTEDVSIRVDIARYGSLLALKNPVKGTGPGTFALAYQEVRPSEGYSATQYVNVAHNDLVEVAVETGIPGVLLFAGLLGWAIYRAVRSSWTGRMVIEAAGAASAVVAAIAFSTLNFIWPVTATLFLWFAVIGLALSIPTSRKTRQDWPVPILILVGLALAAAGGWATRNGMAIEAAWQHARQAEALEQQLEFEQAYEEWTRAVELEPANVLHRAARSKLAEKMAFFSGDPEWIGKALQDIQAAHDASPRNLKILIKEYDLLTALERYEEAEAVIEQAMKVGPYHSHFRRLAAKLYLLKGDLPEAAEVLAWTVLNDDAELRTELGSTVAVLELQTPGAGVAQLQEWAESEDPAYQELARATASELIDRAVPAKLYDFGIAFAKFLADQDKDDLCFQYKLAELKGLKGQPDEELAALETILDDRQDKEKHECYIKSLKRWTEISLERGDTGAVTKRLEEYVRSNDWATGPRVLLSEVYQKAGQEADATRVIKEGLDRRDNDLQLLTRMAELYESRGLTDLARSYYGQVLRREPDNADIKKRIDGLNKKK